MILSFDSGDFNVSYPFFDFFFHFLLFFLLLSLLPSPFSLLPPILVNYIFAFTLPFASNIQHVFLHQSTAAPRPSSVSLLLPKHTNNAQVSPMVLTTLGTPPLYNMLSLIQSPHPHHNTESVSGRPSRLIIHPPYANNPPFRDRKPYGRLHP